MSGIPGQGIIIWPSSELSVQGQDDDSSVGSTTSLPSIFPYVPPSSGEGCDDNGVVRGGGSPTPSLGEASLSSSYSNASSVAELWLVKEQQRLQQQNRTSRSGRASTPGEDIDEDERRRLRILKLSGKKIDPSKITRILVSDPFLHGVDVEPIKKFSLDIDQMKEDCVIPKEIDYSIQNPIQLLPQRVIDFTDRSKIIAARKYGFDKEGFRTGRPLQKAMFYMDPYITCSWCNDMSFVDVEAVHRGMTLPETVGGFVAKEALPPCKCCGRADCFVIGPHDFTAMIASRDRLAREKIERETSAAEVIKRAYRAYLRRAYGSAANKARMARKYLEAKAVTFINAGARGRLARRVYITKKYLRQIKKAHPVLVAWSLKPINGRRQLFWFKKQEHVDLLFIDYVDLLERLGFDPPRKALEENIAELSKRILAREAELLMVVQRRWRGYMARRIVKYYRKELIRMRQFQISKLMMIQRIYRGHFARLQIPKLAKGQRREALMSKYREGLAIKLRDKKKEKIYGKMMMAYARERAEEKTARFTSRVDLPSDHNDRKMKAFAASCYADDKLKNEIDDLMGMVWEDRLQVKADIETEKQRRHFITNRIEEYGPRGFGMRGEKPGNENLVIDKFGFRVGGPLESSRSKGMRAIFEEERKGLMKNLIDRVTNDYVTKISHLPRFKEYNHLRKILGPEDVATAKSEKDRSTSPPKSPLLRMPSTLTAGEKKHKGRRHMVLKMGGDSSAAALFRPRPYKFPADVNESPMSWLDEDMEVILKHQVKSKEAVTDEDTGK